MLQLIQQINKTKKFNTNPYKIIQFAEIQSLLK